MRPDGHKSTSIRINFCGAGPITLLRKVISESGPRYVLQIVLGMTANVIEPNEVCSQSGGDLDTDALRAPVAPCCCI